MRTFQPIRDVVCIYVHTCIHTLLTYFICEGRTCDATLTVISPEVGASSPARHLRNVDFPEFHGPTCNGRIIDFMVSNTFQHSRARPWRGEVGTWHDIRQVWRGTGSPCLLNRAIGMGWLRNRTGAVQACHTHASRLHTPAVLITNARSRSREIHLGTRREIVEQQWQEQRQKHQQIATKKKALVTL